jgi:hypothetical protein
MQKAFGIGKRGQEQDRKERKTKSGARSNHAIKAGLGEVTPAGKRRRRTRKCPD